MKGLLPGLGALGRRGWPTLAAPARAVFGVGRGPGLGVGLGELVSAEGLAGTALGRGAGFAVEGTVPICDGRGALFVMRGPGFGATAFGAGLGIGLLDSTGAFVFPGVGALRAFGLAFSPVFCSAGSSADWAANSCLTFSVTRRTTGVSIVEDAERTNSPISFSLASNCLLSSPSCFASS